MFLNISDSLLNPTFNEPFVIFVIAILSFCFWIGIRFYSTIVIVGASTSFVILMSIVFFDLSILYFYFSLLMTFFCIAIASIQYTKQT